MAVKEIFFKGGILMYPLLFLSILAGGVIIERLIYFFWLSRKEAGILDRLLSLTESGDIANCERECDPGKGPFHNLFRSWLNLMKLNPARLEAEIEHLGSKLLEEMERGLSILSVTGQIAPLLGLLGTVVGMIRAFMVVENLGGRVNASVLAGGIWEALLTTAFGLSIAIPSLLFYYYFEKKVDGYEIKLHRLGHQLLHLAEGRKDGASASEKD